MVEIGTFWAVLAAIVVAPFVLLALRWAWILTLAALELGKTFASVDREVRQRKERGE